MNFMNLRKCAIFCTETQLSAVSIYMKQQDQHAEQDSIKDQNINSAVVLLHL